MTVASRPTSNLVPRIGTYLGVFTVTMATLMYEISLTRIFSVTMWYHFAFVAISVALFGMTLGALTVHLFPSRFREADTKRHLWVYTLLFSVSMAVCFVAQLFIRFTPRLTAGGLVSIVGTCLVISIPFIFSGIVVCLALTRFPDRVNRLYAVDLIGAALGCVLLVALFSWLDGPSLIILVAALTAVAALMFASDLGSRRGMALAAAVAVGLASLGTLNAIRYDDGDAIVAVRWAKGERDTDHLHERWNAFSRLTVDGDPNEPQLGMVIDSTAGTGLIGYSGDPAESDFLRAEISNFAHYAKTDADVLVVGVGGGRDILSALEFEQRSVTGVEINGDILDITNDTFGGFTGQLDEDPRVTFVNDEARSYLTRTDREYDIIQISLIDTWAATAAGAFALSENSLYTAEAWDTFFDRLQPGGILSVSRWYNTPEDDTPLETYRTAALAAHALTEQGIENPRDHILIYVGPPGFYGSRVATVMVSPEPFAPEVVQTLEDQAELLNFSPVLTPDESADTKFADLAAPGGPYDAVAEFSEDISAPTDNRPYFFQMANVETVADGGLLEDRLATRPVLVLAMLALTVLALASFCIALPLLVARRAGHQGVLQKGVAPFYTYFAGIGLGFLLIEISQLQRLSIFLGHPTYGLTVVLFTVLLFSGVGSMLTERFVRPDRPASLVAPLAVLIGVVLLFGFLTPTVVRAMDGSTTPVRIATAVALLAPLGLVMGMPFAIGMRAAARRPATPTAFLWGINGATSVCASVLAVIIALFFGISNAFWVGTLAYLMALASMVAIVRRPVSNEVVTEPEPEPEPRSTTPVLVGGGS